jgi:large subunit ribosomal protein L9
MKIILNKNVAKLGNAGDVLEVATGYAMNKLIPAGLAKMATASEVAKNAENAAQKAKDSLEFKEWAKMAITKLSGKTLVFTEKVSEKGHLFGSVSEKDISARIEKELDVKLEESHISLPKHIKDLGDHRVEIVLSPEYHAALTVRVEGEK